MRKFVLNISLFLFLIGGANVVHASALSLRLNLYVEDWKGGMVSLQKTFPHLQLILKPPSKSEPDGNFTFETFSFRGIPLDRRQSRLEPQLLIEKISDKPYSKWASTNKGFLAIDLPYFPNAKEVIVYFNGLERLKVSVESFARCNEDAVCDAAKGENAVSCPTDCRDQPANNAVQEQVPGDGNRSPDFSQDGGLAAKADQETTSPSSFFSNTSLAYLSIVFILVFVLILVFIIRRRRL